jgi:nucleoside-diphosphate-sugar epimerase
METTTKQVLVLGATGGIGGEVARQLLQRGWKVRALARRLPDVPSRDGIEWRRGDAMNAVDVARAAEGCKVIVHGVNPPGYRRWGELVLPMIDNTIAAAHRHGATVVLPGTIYNYGPDSFPQLREDSPQNPCTRKGAIRVELERRLREATERGCRAIVVRAGDFFGPRYANGWLAQGIVKPGQPVRSVGLPGPGVGHLWAYLPDVARTMAELLERREELPAFATFHMAGYWDADGTQIGQAVQRVVLRHSGEQPKLHAFPWWTVRLAAPFVTTLRELLEMRYLWRVPVSMDNARLVSFLGREPHTPLDHAIEAALVGLGCLHASPPSSCSSAAA